MSGLSRVPSAGSPFHRGSAVIGGALLIMVAALALEPWGRGPSNAVAPSPSSPATIPRAAAPTAAPTAAPGTVRAYDPLAFGEPPGPDITWTIRTPARSIAVPRIGSPVSEDISSGPVADLGPADGLDVVLLTGPTGSRVEALRLWRFQPGGDPVRMELDRPRSPWPSTPAWAIGLRAEAVADDLVGAWHAGLYRLDLLIGPDPRIRMVMLSVGAPRSDATAPPIDAPHAEPFRPEVLDHLPDSANVWTYGGLLSGWARPTSRADCRVAHIWQATDPRDPCWAIPVGRTSALGVNLRDEPVAGIEVARVDPLPGTLALRTDLGIGGRAGLAAAWAAGDGLPDGIYAIRSRGADGGSFHWYVEVGPAGRRAEAINGLVAGLQR